MAISLVISMFAVGVIVAMLAIQVVRTWWKYRGDRMITCPGNLRAAGISVDARRAATHPFARKPELRISSCSRWPQQGKCGQECLKQVAESPSDCLVRHILIQWYAGKSCASCRRPFGEIPLVGVKPAVLCADKKSVEWTEIPADRLTETLAAGAPICFGCHMANSLIRNRPQLVVDRHRTVG
jgi:hypothetical protein